MHRSNELQLAHCADADWANWATPAKAKARTANATADDRMFIRVVPNDRCFALLVVARPLQVQSHDADETSREGPIAAAINSGFVLNHLQAARDECRGIIPFRRTGL